MVTKRLHRLKICSKLTMKTPFSSVSIVDSEVVKGCTILTRQQTLKTSLPSLFERVSGNN